MSKRGSIQCSGRKPRILSYHGLMAREGRELEQLVALIEKTLGPSAQVDSPALLPDKDGGGDREVDVAIRVKSGSSSILVIIECRDRAATQDVRWVEEVAQKRVSVSADKVVAVSSSGFSRGAIEKARALNVDLRVYGHLEPEAIKGWIPPLTLETRYKMWEAKSVELVLDDEMLERLQIVRRAEAVSSIADMRAREHSTNRILTLMELWAPLSLKHPELRYLPADGTRVERRPFVGWTSPEYSYVFPEGEVLLHGFYVKLDAWISDKTQVMSPTGGYFSAHPGEAFPLAAVLETQITLGQAPLVIRAVIPRDGKPGSIDFRRPNS
ncbi:MAG: restriction endonuclease [Planctomycetes bacterium]|nr:restriction endonuclease [Planctomycetota bacterium]